MVARRFDLHGHFLGTQSAIKLIGVLVGARVNLLLGARRQVGRASLG